MSTDFTNDDIPICDAPIDDDAPDDWDAPEKPVAKSTQGSCKLQCPKCQKYGIRGLSRKKCQLCGYVPPDCKGEMRTGFHRVRFSPCRRFAQIGKFCAQHHDVKGRAIDEDALDTEL